jgi:hypothetical protein
VTSRAASTAELAVLNHPDQRTSWIVVAVIELEGPIAYLPELSRRRLSELSDRAPILRERWRDGAWRLGSPPQPVVVDGDPIDSPALLGRFELDREPPLRLLVTADCRRLALATHHAALDGRAMTAILAALLGQPPPSAPRPSHTPAQRSVTPSAGAGVLAGLRRLIAPADRVAPSPDRPPRESFAVRDVVVRGPNVTGAIAEACVAAMSARNARRGWPSRRIGLSLALGGPPTVGNVASYRRLDLAAGASVSAAVQRALRSEQLPLEHLSAPRALRVLGPISHRFSDSLLVSNLGCTELAGVKRFAFFPVARGRSAVAFGASAVRRDRSTLSLRARDLSQADAESLIDEVAGRLPRFRKSRAQGRRMPSEPPPDRVWSDTDGHTASH